jgi:hypothetical protein
MERIMNSKKIATVVMLFVVSFVLGFGFVKCVQHHEEQRVKYKQEMEIFIMKVIDGRMRQRPVEVRMVGPDGTQIFNPEVLELEE